jgi:hypothetical protein
MPNSGNLCSIETLIVPQKYAKIQNVFSFQKSSLKTMVKIVLPHPTYVVVVHVTMCLGLKSAALCKQVF